MRLIRSSLIWELVMACLIAIPTFSPTSPSRPWLAPVFLVVFIAWALSRTAEWFEARRREAQRDRDEAERQRISEARHLEATRHAEVVHGEAMIRADARHTQAMTLAETMARQSEESFSLMKSVIERMPAQVGEVIAPLLDLWGERQRNVRATMNGLGSIAISPSLAGEGTVTPPGSAKLHVVADVPSASEKMLDDSIRTQEERVRRWIHRTRVRSPLQQDDDGDLAS
jgi:hypothetical protein